MRKVKALYEKRCEKKKKTLDISLCLLYSNHRRTASGCPVKSENEGLFLQLRIKFSRNINYW